MVSKRFPPLNKSGRFSSQMSTTYKYGALETVPPGKQGLRYM